MRIIIPMAGRGSRLRPHTLTTPKPLIPVAGKPMVQRIVEDLTVSYNGKVEEIAFVIGDFGKEVEQQLISIANELGAEGRIFYQKEPLGTAHAILCAKECLIGNCIIGFSDTLFKADFQFDVAEEGIIWVQKVEDPSSFGVVKIDDNDIITDFVEKSPTFISDLAIVGLYYVKDAAILKEEMQYLIDNDIKDKGEYQLTSALENMKQKGASFKAARIEEWLDCGNKENIITTNQRMLEIKKEQEKLIAHSSNKSNAQIIEPCFIGENVKLENSIIGPHVSIGHNSRILNSVIQNSVIQNDTFVKNAILSNSMLGSQVVFEGKMSDISVGDFTIVKE